MSSSDTETGKDAADPFHKKYKVLGQVGEGSYSKVVKCRDRETAEEFACKRLKHCYRNWNQVNDINEVVVLRQLSRHNNILQFTDILFDPAAGRVSMVFELMEMNLYELIKDRKRLLPEARVRNIIFQLIRGLRHLHKHGIFHRDVKPENILLRKFNGEDLLKIGDLGSVRGIISKMPYTEYISTRWYRSPECLLTSGYYGVKMDIWAVGCVFFEVLTLRPLFPGSSELDQINRIHTIMGGPPQRIMERFAKHAEEPREYNKHHKLSRFEGISKILVEFGWTPSKSRNFDWHFATVPKEGSGIDRMIPAHVSPEARDLIKTLLQYDPELRPTAHRSIGHAYFNELREAARHAKVDYDLDEPESKLDPGPELPRLGDNKLKRSELAKAPNSGIKLDGSRGRMHPKLPTKLPTEVQSFSHRREEKEVTNLPPKKAFSEDKTTSKPSATTSAFANPKSSDRQYIAEASRTKAKPTLPYEKNYEIDQNTQKQYYTELRGIANKTRVVASKAQPVDESLTKFVRQDSDSVSRAAASSENRRSARKGPRPEAHTSSSRLAMKVAALQKPALKLKAIPQLSQREERLPAYRNPNPETKIKKVITTSMFPVLTESGRKYKGDASPVDHKPSNAYEKYLEERRLQDLGMSGAAKKNLNVSVSDYKYIPKHQQMSPQHQTPQRQISGKRNKQLEGKPSLLSLTKSASLTKERKHRREREKFDPRMVSLSPITPSPRKLAKGEKPELVDKAKLSPEDLQRINENRRLVNLDPIGSSDIEIRKRYETLITHRASIKHSEKLNEIDESDDDPQPEVSHRVKRPRKIEDIRRRARPRRIEDIQQTEDDREKMEDIDSWNKPFPVEELTQYHPNHPSHPNSNNHRKYRDDKYANAGNAYNTEKPQQVQYSQSKLQARNSPLVTGSLRGTSDIQAIYGGGRVEQRKSSHHLHKKPSMSRIPHGTMQQDGPNYTPEYQNERSSHYEPSKAYRTYRDGRQVQNMYSSDERHYVAEKLRPAAISRRPSPRNDLYTPVINKKGLHGSSSGRPGLDSKIPVRTFQPSLARMPPVNMKRPEPTYETQYPMQSSSHYETYRSYRDEGRGHNIPRETRKPPHQERQRKPQILPGRSQVYHQIDPTNLSVSERLGLKPPKVGRKPSASRIQHTNSMRGGLQYGERRRGLDD